MNLQRFQALNNKCNILPYHIRKMLAKSLVCSLGALHVYSGAIEKGTLNDSYSFLLKEQKFCMRMYVLYCISIYHIIQIVRSKKLSQFLRISWLL